MVGAAAQGEGGLLTGAGGGLGVPAASSPVLGQDLSKGPAAFPEAWCGGPSAGSMKQSEPREAGAGPLGRAQEARLSQRSQQPQAGGATGKATREQRASK